MILDHRAPLVMLDLQALLDSKDPQDLEDYLEILDLLEVLEILELQDHLDEMVRSRNLPVIMYVKLVLFVQ